MSRNTRCALFIEADPITKKDIRTIKNVLKIYDFIDIIMDRKYNDGIYIMNFDQRVDVVKHDLATEGITNYEIHPNDISRYESIEKLGVTDVAVEINNFSDLGDLYTRSKMLNEITKDVNVIFIPSFDEDAIATKEYLYKLVNEDFTHTVYRKYMSDYAYFKLKMKLVDKICVIGQKYGGISEVLDVFKDREYDVIDLEKIMMRLSNDQKNVAEVYNALTRNKIRNVKKMIRFDGKNYMPDRVEFMEVMVNDSKAREIFNQHITPLLYKEIAKTILESRKRTIVFGFDLGMELGMLDLFDSIICVNATPEYQMKKMVLEGKLENRDMTNILKFQIPINEKIANSDYVIDGNDITNQTIRLINKKISKRL